MRRFGTALLGSVTAFALATSALAQASSSSSGGNVDCGKFDGVKLQDTYKEDPDEVHDCMAFGWDPPVNWRPNKGHAPGIRVGGAGGFSHGTIQAPDMPPWKQNDASSNGGLGNGSTSSSSSGINFPPWPGFPNLPGTSSGSSNGGSGSSSSSSSSGGGCPTSNEDDDATFGAKQPLTGSVALECGGAAPATIYQMSLSKNADTLFITEDGYFTYWIYKKQGNTYKLISPANAMLPNKLCNDTVLQPPIAQMISFNSGSPSIAVRLKQLVPLGDPLAPVVPPAEPEKEVVLGVSGGTVQVPGCIDTANYKSTTAIGDIVFDPIISGGCEAPPEVCTQQGISPTPSALPDCTMISSYPTGTACTNKTQIVLLDRPNVIFPSGTSAVSTPIDGMTAVMLATAAGSSIHTKEGWIVHLGEPAASFELPQGGMVGLADGNVLDMSGPATISGSGQVTLTHGGALQTAGGTTITSYPDGTVLNPNVIKPVPLRIHAIVNMPAGYMVPSSPSAKVRLPVQTR